MSLRDLPSLLFGAVRHDSAERRRCCLQCPFLGWHREFNSARTKEAARRKLPVQKRREDASHSESFAKTLDGFR
jgi:hypothetical protein